MKEIKFFRGSVLLLLMFFLSSCFSFLPITETQQSQLTETQQSPRYQWIVSNFVNEWGDDLDIYYTIFTGSSQGFYSNTFDSDRPTEIKDITFSYIQGLYFVTPENVSFFDETVNIIVRHPDGTEYYFTGGYAKRGSHGIIIVEFTDELLNSLFGENIVIRFITESNYRCQFSFPPGFEAGVEQLNLKINS
ncbi:MAG: hypothetical protein FWH35_08350 [Treponema sp.]|nr:hypothetical protein [Treponema sp.]